MFIYRKMQIRFSTEYPLAAEHFRLFRHQLCSFFLHIRRINITGRRASSRVAFPENPVRFVRNKTGLNASYGAPTG
jgi:hypothetical protein